MSPISPNTGRMYSTAVQCTVHCTGRAGGGQCPVAPRPAAAPHQPRHSDSQGAPRPRTRCRGGRPLQPGRSDPLAQEQEPPAAVSWRRPRWTAITPPLYLDMGLLLVKVPALTQLCCILKYPFPYSPQLYINTSVDTINLSDKSFRLETEIAEAMSLQNELSL